MINYQMFSLISGLIIVSCLIVLVRRSKIHYNFLTWWVIISIFILIFAFCPKIINTIGHWFGVSYPPILIVIAGVGFLLVKTLSMDIYITRNEIRYKTIAQKLALLEKHIEDQSRLTQKISEEREMKH